MLNMLPNWFLHGLYLLSGMETELFAAVTAGDTEKAKQLLTKETKETIDQVFFKSKLLISPDIKISGSIASRIAR